MESHPRPRGLDPEEQVKGTQGGGDWSPHCAQDPQLALRHGWEGPLDLALWIARLVLHQSALPPPSLSSKHTRLSVPQVCQAPVLL